MMRYLLALLATAAFAKTPAKVKEKLNCDDREIARQDCRLSSGDYNVRLLPKTVAWTDGTWHTVDPMPLKGEAVEWERAGFRMLAGRPILQIWLWEKGVGETQVQSLHWFTADAEKRKLTILAEGVVRKRRPESKSETAETPKPAKKGSGAIPKVEKQKFIYDGWEPHYVKVLPNGTLEWSLTGEKRVLPKGATITETKHDSAGGEPGHRSKGDDNHGHGEH